MKRSSYDHMRCSLARALDVVGEWWTLLVVRDVLYGLHRFDDIQADLGIARNVLADRLRTLVDAGVLERRQYSSHPPRHDYHLTAKGRDLLPVLVTLAWWGDKWQAHDEGPATRMAHRGCDGAVTGQPGYAEPALRCDRCGEELGYRDLLPVVAPGVELPVPLPR